VPTFGFFSPPPPSVPCSLVEDGLTCCYLNFSLLPPSPRWQTPLDLCLFLESLIATTLLFCVAHALLDLIRRFISFRTNKRYSYSVFVGCRVRGFPSNSLGGRSRTVPPEAPHFPFFSDQWFFLASSRASSNYPAKGVPPARHLLFAFLRTPIFLGLIAGNFSRRVLRL